MDWLLTSLTYLSCGLFGVVLRIGWGISVKESLVGVAALANLVGAMHSFMNPFWLLLHTAIASLLVIILLRGEPDRKVP